MSILKQINLNQIKYYGKNDIFTNWFSSEYENNYDFILNSILLYKNYDELIKKDFILSFYVINLFLFNEDVNKNFYKNLSFNFKENFNDFIYKIKENLKIKNIKHLIKLFINWILINLNIILEKHFLDELNIFNISLYNEILKIFLIFPKFDNEEQVKNLINLLEKNPSFFINCITSDLKDKYKLIIKDGFFSFILKAMQNNEFLVQNFDFIDFYIKFQKEAKNEILIKNIINYYKNQINQIENITQQISFAQLFINIVKKHGLKGKWEDTKNLEIWYENLSKILFNSDEIKKIKFPSIDPEYNEKITKIITDQKQGIKNGTNKNLFYQYKTKRAFLFPLDNKKYLHTTIFGNNIGTYNNTNIFKMSLHESYSKQLFSSLFFDQKIFELYTSNFADTLESVLYSLDISEEENVFFIERYYEIIKQLNEERENKENDNHFLYMKNITLVLTAIENLIKLFIKNVENLNNNIVNIDNPPFSSFLVEKNNNDFKKGTIFTPSKYITTILSNDCKMILNYYLYSNRIDGGLEIRNLIVHGSFVSKDFCNQYWLFEITRLFIQLVEEVTMNYICNILEKIDINSFFRTLDFKSFIMEEKAKVINDNKQINDYNFIPYLEKYVNKELEIFFKKNNIKNIKSFLTLKLNYLKETNEFELEISLFRTFTFKIAKFAETG